MLRRLLLLLAAGAISAALAAEPAASRSRVETETLQLPDMTVFGGLTKQDFIFPRKNEVTAPAFPENDPSIKVNFPGRAVYEGVATGRATVGVMLDQNGKPVDFLLIRYTRDYFGKALLEEARHQGYAAKRVRGVAVPGPFIFSYHYEPPDGLTAISSFEAADRRAESVQGGPRFIYEPRRETELDAGQLEPTQIRIPVLPPHLAAPDQRPVRVFVTFYVDEQGRVRLPNIESALAPELIAPALAALQQWTFKAPTIKTQPVLVRAMRALTFRELPTNPPVK